MTSKEKLQTTHEKHVRRAWFSAATAGFAGGIAFMLIVNIIQLGFSWQVALTIIALLAIAVISALDVRTQIYRSVVTAWELGYGKHDEDR